MSYQLPEGIALHSDGGHLILPANIDATGLAQIQAGKARIIAELRDRQMDSAGFYTCVPAHLLEEIKATPWLAVAIMTTGKTRFSKPIRISKATPVGHDTWLAYRATHPGTRILTVPRVRILSTCTPELGHCSWDLDTLVPDDRRCLFEAVLDRKIIVAHDAGNLLSWLLGETPGRPDKVLDTSILVQQIRPKTLLRPFEAAVKGDVNTRAQARELIAREKGGPSSSLEWIATCLQLPVPDGRFHQHPNWCVSYLSPGHRKFTNCALDIPLRILEFLFPSFPVESISDAAREQFPWYWDYAKAATRLAEAHLRGVPFDHLRAEKLHQELAEDIKRAAQALKNVPELAPYYNILADPTRGETDEQRSATSTVLSKLDLSAHPECEGDGHPCGDSTSAPSSALLASVQTIRTSKAGYLTTDHLVRAAASDGFLHSLLGFRASTGRTVSAEPALQNIPKEQRFRSLIKARPGNCILSLDYGRAELVIASALADRAIADIRRHLDEENIDCWFMERVFVGAHTAETLTCPSEPSKVNVEWLAQAIPAIIQRVLSRPVQQMAAIFAAGLDPHLVTALEMERRRKGHITYGEDLIGWLKSLDEQHQRALKVTLHDERQKAKPTNFGLLYGMSSEGLFASGVEGYGLSWTLDEARGARQAWFTAYPEFQVWHWWTKFMQSREIAKDKCMVWNSRLKTPMSPEHPVKLYESTTLSGRPLVVLNDLRKAINYQAQATGADILARAIATLPNEIAEMLLLPVHDELVFEVPVAAAEEVKRLATNAMVQAAAEVLGNAVGVEVDAHAGKAWC